jgi:hypothetical protein
MCRSLLQLLEAALSAGYAFQSIAQLECINHHRLLGRYLAFPEVYDCQLKRPSIQV